jgi:hypothetical protein
MTEENKVSKEWLEGTTTISREQFGDIIADEINTALLIAKLTGADDVYELLDGFLPDFSARVAARVFNDVDKNENEPDEEDK